jgi:hypothetical protein
MRKAIKDAGMLRAEGRFALAFGAPLLAFGLAAAVGHSLAAALSPDPIPQVVRGALFGGPPILMGWIACRYAAWRLEEAKAVEARRSARRPKRHARGVVFLRRFKQSAALLAAKAARRQ